jgi:hypothetical protein
MTERIIDCRPSDGCPYECAICGQPSLDPDDCLTGFYRDNDGSERPVCVHCEDRAEMGLVPGFRPLRVSDVAEQFSRAGVPGWPNRDGTPVSPDGMRRALLNGPTNKEEG